MKSKVMARKAGVTLLLVFLVLSMLTGLSVVSASSVVSNLEPLSVDWQDFWQKFNKIAAWDLEFNSGGWISKKGDMTIQRDYPQNDTCKITLIFDASEAGDYRLSFAINKKVTQYLEKASNWEYILSYENYTITFDWSDVKDIPGLIVTHGVLSNYFWFRIRRNNVPLGAHVEIDPTLIAQVDDIRNFIWPYQRRTFHAAGRYWIFYTDEISETEYCPLLFKSSTDGETWSEETSLGNVGGPGTSAYEPDVDYGEAMQFSLFFYGSYLHIVKMLVYTLYYRRGVPLSDGSITWTADWQTIYAGDQFYHYYYPGVAVDTEGYPWVGVHYTYYTGIPPMGFKCYVIKSSRNDGYWQMAGGFPFLLSAGTYIWQVLPVPLNNTQMCILWTRDGATLSSRFWDGTSMGPAEIAGGGPNTYGDRFSAVGFNNTVHFVYLNNANNIRYRNKTIGGSWSTEVTVQAADGLYTQWIAPILGVNATGGDLKCFYAYANATAQYMRFKNWTQAAGWDADPTVWFEGTAGIAFQSLGGFYQNYGDKYGLAHIDAPSQNLLYDSMEWLGYADPPPPPPITFGDFEISNMDCGDWLFAEEDYYEMTLTAGVSELNSTFYSDTSIDGYINRTDPFYPPLGETNYVNATYRPMVGQVNATGNYTIYRGYISFDTTGLPDDINIESATLSMAMQADDSDTDFNITVYSGNDQWTSQETCGWADCTTSEGTFFDTTGKALDTYYEMSISPSSITIDGLTQFRLITAREGTAPAGDEYVTFYQGGESYQPSLYITYTYKIEELRINFTDGAGRDVVIYYDNQASTGGILNGADYVFLAHGAIETTAYNHTLEVTWEVMLRAAIIDRFDTDFYASGETTMSNTSGWILVKSDYANIYSRGALSTLEVLPVYGSSVVDVDGGRIAQGDIFSLYAGNGTTAEAALIYRSLQHIKMRFGIDLGNVRLSAFNEIHYRIGWQFKRYDDEDWQPGFYIDIEFDTLPPYWELDTGESNRWIGFNITLYVNDIKTSDDEQTYVFYNMPYLTKFPSGNPVSSPGTNPAEFFFDLWINKENASSMFGFGVAPVYFGMSTTYGDKLWAEEGYDYYAARNASQSPSFFETIIDSNNDTVFASEIAIQRIWANVSYPEWYESENPYPGIRVTGFEIFDFTFAQLGFIGIQTPPQEETRIPKMDAWSLFGTGLFAALFGAIGTAWQAIVPAIDFISSGIVGLIDAGLFQLTRQPRMLGSFLDTAVAAGGQVMSFMTYLGENVVGIGVAVTTTTELFFTNLFGTVWGIIDFLFLTPSFNIFTAFGSIVGVSLAWLGGTTYTNGWGQVYDFSYLSSMTITGTSLSGGITVFYLIFVCGTFIQILACVGTMSIEPIAQPIRLFWGVMMFMITVLEILWNITTSFIGLLVKIVHAIRDISPRPFGWTCTLTADVMQWCHDNDVW